MTRRALKPCASPVCPELVRPPARYCPDHARSRDRARGTPAQRGYDHRWRQEADRYRDARREAGTYACDECGSSSGTLEVDHVDGLGPLGPRGFDWSNLQLLCRSDHQRKTALQTGTAGGPE